MTQMTPRPSHNQARTNTFWKTQGLHISICNAVAPGKKDNQTRTTAIISYGVLDTPCYSLKGRVMLMFTKQIDFIKEEGVSS